MKLKQADLQKNQMDIMKILKLNITIEVKKNWKHKADGLKRGLDAIEEWGED